MLIVYEMVLETSRANVCGPARSRVARYAVTTREAARGAAGATDGASVPGFCDTGDFQLLFRR